MSTALDLLRECNQILIRLHDVNKQQILHMKKGDFNRLNIFADKRQAILEMLDIVEEQLDNKLDHIAKQDHLTVAKEIRLRKEILESILTQEMDLHKIVEHEKTRTMLDIQNNAKNLKVTSAYKSGGEDKRKILKEI